MKPFLKGVYQLNPQETQQIYSTDFGKKHSFGNPENRTYTPKQSFEMIITCPEVNRLSTISNTK